MTKFFKINILILVFALVFVSGAKCFANVLPISVYDVPKNAIGVYQTDSKVTVYEKPSSTSKVLFDYDIDYKSFSDKDRSDVFAVIVPDKQLGYLYVIDTSEDENWVKVVYNKYSMDCGWVYKNDEFQFMPWFDFVSLYGRKYGITQLRTKDYSFEVYSNPDDDAQIIGKISHPRYIRMTSIEGNWLLVTALDSNNEIITGYIKWRNTSGEIFFFPLLK